MATLRFNRPAPVGWFDHNGLHEAALKQVDPSGDFPVYEPQRLTLEQGRQALRAAGLFVLPGYDTYPYAVEVQKLVASDWQNVPGCYEAFHADPRNIVGVTRFGTEVLVGDVPTSAGDYDEFADGLDNDPDFCEDVAQALARRQAHIERLQPGFMYFLNTQIVHRTPDYSGFSEPAIRTVVKRIFNTSD